MNIFKRHRRTAEQLHVQHGHRSRSASSARDKVLSDPVTANALHTLR